MRSTDEVYGSLPYDGAQLLHVPLCVSWAFLITAAEARDATAVLFSVSWSINAITHERCRHL